MRNFILLALFFLTSCGSGDRLQFRNPGNASITLNSVCINAQPGKVLSYYLLSSSVNHYKKPIATEDNIKKSYPDTCISTSLQSDAKYTLIYILDNDKYRLEFSVDRQGKISPGGR
ncbi:putative T6SS immunity periplasmic lipoprotein [Pantoea sp. FN0307]|uniref:putative T6SS immunity periplasmic lipoprotein n=1 Tax=Pantoea sp. FN0307 TaxID=3418560 RepID=UPI003CF20DF9